MNHIQLLQGDITQAKVDAIVNAANPIMLGGGGVDGAIHKAAGPELLSACESVPATDGIRCPTGEARITTAGRLKANYVIHTVGPVYANETHAAELLASSYQNSLALAVEYNCYSIAFPAISCGVYGYPLTEAAEVALSICSRKEYQTMEILFYLFNESILKVWRNVLEIKKAD